MHTILIRAAGTCAGLLLCCSVVTTGRAEVIALVCARYDIANPLYVLHDRHSCVDGDRSELVRDTASFPGKDYGGSHRMVRTEHRSFRNLYHLSNRSSFRPPAQILDCRSSNWISAEMQKSAGLLVSPHPARRELGSALPSKLS